MARIKADTIIKMYQLAETMFLTNEEFGTLIRKVMIEDDRTEQRYKRLSDDDLEVYKEFEKQWLEDYENLLKKNPRIRQDHSKLFGQAASSHDAFLKRQQYQDDKQSTEVPSQKKRKTETKKNSHDVVYFWFDGSQDDKDASDVFEFLSKCGLEENTDIVIDYLKNNKTEMSYDVEAVCGFALGDLDDLKED